MRRQERRRSGGHRDDPNDAESTLHRLRPRAARMRGIESIVWMRMERVPLAARRAPDEYARHCAASSPPGIRAEFWRVNCRSGRMFSPVFRHESNAIGRKPSAFAFNAIEETNRRIGRGCTSLFCRLASTCAAVGDRRGRRGDPEGGNIR